ncbi:MAG: FISUMP domain-containing protein [Acidobacteriota bacterium]|nr:FISUMP domain-containing protein [Acidobacteriota bacterium]
MKFTDSRDGNEYRTVQLRDGRQWLAENLRFVTNDESPGSYPRLDMSFPPDSNPPEKALATNPSYSSENYGRLYTWAAAQRAAPAGWHVPSAKEWKRLFDCYGGWAHDVHANMRENNDIALLAQELDVEFGGCVRASGVGIGVPRDGEIYYRYLDDFMGARFWSSSRPIGFKQRKFSGIYFLLRPNPRTGPDPRAAPTAHRSEEVLDYAFSVRCVAD